MYEIKVNGYKTTHFDAAHIILDTVKQNPRVIAIVPEPTERPAWFLRRTPGRAGKENIWEEKINGAIDDFVRDFDFSNYDQGVVWLQWDPGRDEIVEVMLGSISIDGRFLEVE